MTLIICTSAALLVGAASGYAFGRRNPRRTAPVPVNVKLAPLTLAQEQQWGRILRRAGEAGRRAGRDVGRRA